MKSSLPKVMTFPFEGYLCPLCIQLFELPDDFTLEHVPPRSIGGKELCLTCIDCNETAGRTIDVHPAKEIEQQSFLALENEHYRATWKIAGDRLQVNVKRDSDGRFSIEVLGDVNNPATVQKVKDGAAQRMKSGATYEIEWGPVLSRRSADVSFLKSAYLAAFAKLGYRFILQGRFNLVRQQIQEPENPLIETLRMHDHGADLSCRRLLILDQPIRCLLVQIGPAIAWLPLDTTAEELYERMRRPNTGAKSVTIHAPAAMTWPKTCEFISDSIDDQQLREATSWFDLLLQLAQKTGEPGGDK